jgi:hypothetical protein
LLNLVYRALNLHSLILLAALEAGAWLVNTRSKEVLCASQHPSTMMIPKGQP